MDDILYGFFYAALFAFTSVVAVSTFQFLLGNSSDNLLTIAFKNTIFFLMAIAIVWYKTTVGASDIIIPILMVIGASVISFVGELLIVYLEYKFRG